MRYILALLLISTPMTLTPHSNAAMTCECDDIEGWELDEGNSSCVLRAPICGGDGNCSYVLHWEEAPHETLSGDCVPLEPNLQCLCDLDPGDQVTFDLCDADPDCTIVIGDSCDFPTCVSQNPGPPYQGPASGSCQYTQEGPPPLFRVEDNCVPTE